MVSACVSQVPWTYATLDSSSDETAHASNFAQAPDAQPKTETPDGTTYADNRFGTARTLTAAENQPRRLGPVLMTWTSYDASAWSPGDASSPLSVTLAATGSYQRVNALDILQTSYDATSAGWPLMTHLAMNYATSGPECMREQAAAGYYRRLLPSNWPQLCVSFRHCLKPKEIVWVAPGGSMRWLIFPRMSAYHAF